MVETIDPNRLDDVLDPLCAQEVVAERQFGLDLIVDAAGDENPAGVGQRLQAGRNVDAVTVQIGAFDDDITKVDADAELQPAATRETGVPLRQFLLNLNRAARCLHRARKLGKNAVPGGPDNAAVVTGDQCVYAGSMALERAQRAFLVRFHEAAEASHVGGQDRGESALCGRRCGRSRRCQAQWIRQSPPARYPTATEEWMASLGCAYTPPRGAEWLTA